MPRLSRPLAVSLLLGLLLSLLWGGAAGLGLLARPEWFAYHALFELRGERERPRDVTLVAIDEASLEALGVWPLPRSLYAQLIDGLFASGARVVGLDVTFPQAQSTATDGAFAAALARHPDRVVLAANFQPVGNDQAQGEQLVLPYAPLRRHAALGFANLPYDEDVAIHRCVPVRLGPDPEDAETPRAYESFDWALARRFAPGRFGAAAPGELLINYAGGPGHVRTVSLIQALEGLAERNPHVVSQFKDRIVLVGATSMRMQDLYATPYSAGALGGGAATYMPGVEIHAHILDTLLRAGPLQPLSPAGRWAWLLALGLAAAWGFGRLSPWRGLGLLALLAVGGFAVVLLAFTQGLWLGVVAPSVGLLASLYTVAVIAHFGDSERTRRYYRRTFERYVAPEIVSEILRNPGLAPKLGGEKREVSVLFSDIRSFTTISEKLEPEAVVEFLNAYLTAMAEVIHAEQGCIDKYIGDAILALWGNVQPVSSELAARQAVRAALAMKARVAELQSAWQAKGYPLIEIGVGVNTGPAIVGNIGSPNKLEFGVIGDSINVASRLEGLTKQYDGALLVSGRTRELLGEGFICRYLDTVKVKGREAPVPIYAVEGEANAPSRGEAPAGPLPPGAAEGKQPPGLGAQSA